MNNGNMTLKINLFILELDRRTHHLYLITGIEVNGVNAVPVGSKIKT